MKQLLCITFGVLSVVGVFFVVVVALVLWALKDEDC